MHAKAHQLASNHKIQFARLLYTYVLKSFAGQPWIIYLRQRNIRTTISLSLPILPSTICHTPTFANETSAGKTRDHRYPLCWSSSPSLIYRYAHLPSKLYFRSLENEIVSVLYYVIRRSNDILLNFNILIKGLSNVHAVRGFTPKKIVPTVYCVYLL